MTVGHKARRMINYLTPLLAMAALVLPASLAMAQDRVDLEGASIIGNRELPKVLYIVPWHMPGEGGLEEPPARGLLEETLGPLDREVFRRQLEYQHLIEQQAARQAKP